MGVLLNSPLMSAPGSPALPKAAKLSLDILVVRLPRQTLPSKKRPTSGNVGKVPAMMRPPRRFE